MEQKVKPFRLEIAPKHGIFKQREKDELSQHDNRPQETAPRLQRNNIKPVPDKAQQEQQA
ncbi:MAG: hypothetical protein ABEK16_05680 [Candidatus Nanohalobium sp.]